MKNVAVAASVAILGTLAGCGHAVDAREAAPPVPTDSVRLDAGRFRTLFEEMGDLVARADAVGNDSVPGSAEAANRLLGLDGSSPLRFAELVQSGHAGRTCLVSDAGTYLTVSGGDQERLVVLLGDGDCSYASDAAAVVGNPVTGRWTKGAELMGDAKVGDVFPTVTFEPEELSAGGVPAAPEVRLLIDAKVLGTAVAQYAFEHQAYPAVPADRLVETVSTGGGPRLGSRTRVFAYRHGRTGFALCLVDGRGSWARWNRLGQSTHGTYSSLDELDACAAPVAADGS